jgi:hypothetical protein
VRPPFDAKSTVECVPPGLHPAAEEWLQLPRAPATGSGCALRRRGRPTSHDDVAGVSVWRVCRVLKFSQTPARMSRPIVSSPTLRFNRFIFFSRSVSSSFCRARSALSAPSRKRSRYSSTSATFSPCRRAASAAFVSPISKLTISAARRSATLNFFRPLLD